MQITTIGLDLAKRVFQVHGVDGAGAVVVRRRLTRRTLRAFFAELPPCRVGLEACGSAHFWAREIAALGHDVRIMPPAYVKPYVKRGKNDATDAAAICEAVSRPHMRFVPIKTEEQQSAQMLLTARDLAVRQQTMLINALRTHMAELGVVAAKGAWNIAPLIAVIEDDADESIPDLATRALRPLVAQLRAIEATIAALDAEILAWHRANERSRRLATIPGIGTLTAAAIAIAVPDAKVFASGRAFAAWLGLVPRQASSGGKQRLGRIAKQGNRMIRRLLVLGATARLRAARAGRDPASAWIRDLLARRPARLVTVAMANKTARIAWALLVRGEAYRAPGPAGGAVTAAAA